MKHTAILYPLLAATLTAVLTACATSPMGHRQLQLFSQGELAKMGAESYQQIKQKTPITKNKAVRNYVNCVAHALTREIGGEWEVTVFQSDEVNAFALPGGKIGVYTGLLDVAEGQGQLAAVIGHEVGHVLADHSNARMSAQFATSAGVQLLGAALGSSGSIGGRQMMSALGLGAQVGLLLPYSRGQESEADLIGLKLMAQSGFDPREAVGLWRNMRDEAGGEPPAFLSTHPTSSDRIKALQNNMKPALQDYRNSSARPACG